MRREAKRRREEDVEKGHDNKRRHDAETNNDQEANFGFSILDTRAILGEEVKMKNIPPSVLQNFYGMSCEDPNSFMFEFDILCRTYGYIDDTHKPRLFPATFKAATLKWFMGLGEHTIASWEDMRNFFLKKYQAYCKPRDSKEDIFRMSQKEDESLEEYLERFIYNLQKSKQHSLNPDTVQ